MIITASPLRNAIDNFKTMQFDTSDFINLIYSLEESQLCLIYCKKLVAFRGVARGEGQRGNCPLPPEIGSVTTSLLTVGYIIRLSRCRQARAHPGGHRAMALRPYHPLSLVSSTKLELFA